MFKCLNLRNNMNIVLLNHNKNTPIQIYCKFYHLKLKISDKNSDIFHISAQDIDSHEYLLSMFLSRNRKNNVYPCKHKSGV